MRIPARVQWLISVVLALAWRIASASADDGTITWISVASPPYHIGSESGNSGALVGKGMDDLQLDALFRALPQYQHHRSFSSMPRMMHMLEGGEHVCSLAIPTPERLRKFYFTYTDFAGPLLLITRTDVLPRLPPHTGAVALTQVVRDPGLRGLIIAGRSYTDRLDAIARSSSGTRIPEIVLSASQSNLMQMLLNGRMDYTLEYGVVLKYLQESDDQYGTLVGVPLSESRALIRAGVICPRNDWGRTVIERLDRAMVGLIRQPDYRQDMERWLTDSEKRAYKQQIAEFYRFRSSAERTNIGKP